MRPGKARVTRIIEQPGTVEAFEQTVLFAKIAGYVANIHVDIGQRVAGPTFDDKGEMTKPGQILAEIAVPELEEEAKQKIASIQQADAEIEQAKRSLHAEEANVEAIRSGVNEALAAQQRAEALHVRWSSEAERQAGLVERGVIDSQTAEETKNQFQAAEAGLAEAKARVVSAKAAVTKAIADKDKAAADVNAAIARREVCVADHRRIAAMLGYTKIRAPYDGIITERSVSTGDFLQPGSGDKAGVFTIARIDPARVILYVPEVDSALVTDGTPISLEFPSAGLPSIDAAVTRTSWSLDPGSRTLHVEVDVPNHDGRLRAGTYVFARLPAARPEAWTLPATAVVKQGDAMVAFLFKDGKVIRTPLKVGGKDDKRIEVLAMQDSADSSQWHRINGSETFAVPASGLSNGQPVLAKE
ncbi:MAG: efflux RND transporter periplasmic adaptor subunit [Planctomycetota bacterium]